MKQHIDYDATLCCWFFQLLSVVEVRITNEALRNILLKNKYLELSILYIFDQFRDAYLGIIPGSRFIISQHLSNNREGILFNKLSELLNTPNMDHSLILSTIVNKIIMNLSTWTEDLQVLEQSIKLLHRLSSEYGTASLICVLPAIIKLLHNHSSNSLPFLKLAKFASLHITFYHTLSRLAFKFSTY